MKAKITLMVILLFISITSFSQPVIDWQKSLGGSYDDEAWSIQQTSDGGYIVAGRSVSTDGDVTGHHGSFDYWVVKLSSTATIEWQKSLGGSNFDFAYSIQQTSDGGYIVSGYSESNDDDVTGNHGSTDYWIIKLSATATTEWQKSLGGSGEDVANSIQQTSDGGYIIAGMSKSTDGDVTGNHGGWDYWVVKLSATGTMDWQKCLGGSEHDRAQSIRQTSDGGYIVVGMAYSTDGDVSGINGNADYWVVKLSATATIEWQKCLGGSNYDEARSIQQTSDGGYIIAGWSASTNGDVSGNHGNYDYWVVKLSATATIEWQKCLGGSSFDYAHHIQQTSDGGYIVAGRSSSTNGDVNGNHGGSSDYWVVKLTATGSIEWQKCLGGSGEDIAQSIQQTSDEGYIIAGMSKSNDGEVTGNHGGFDYWVVKLSSFVGVNNNELTNTIILYPNPASSVFSVKSVVINRMSTVVEIYDLNGRKLLETHIPVGNEIVEIDVSHLESGIYLCTMITEQGSATKKLIIQK